MTVKFEPPFGPRSVPVTAPLFKSSVAYLTVCG